LWTNNPEIQKALALIEEEIKKNTRTKNKALNDIVTGLFSAGGKRLRPAFVVLASKFGKSQTPKTRRKVVSIASAIEILHAATLVHDDIVDKSDIRRGKTTINKAHGNSIALYIGDLLYTKSVLTLSRDIPVDRLETIAKAIKTLCEGEIDQFLDRRNLKVSVLSYLKSIARKTAGLFGAACSSGAYIAKCTYTDANNLTRFGINYGMAFQIRDDLNDFQKNEHVTGKTFGKDITEGVITLPFIFAIREDKQIKVIFDNAFSESRKVTRPEMDEIVERVLRTDALNKTHAILDKYIARGNVYASKLPNIKEKSLLIEMINSLNLGKIV